MKGAENLICPKCGGFFAHFSEQNKFGRVTKVIKCNCGLEQRTVTDGFDQVTIIQIGEKILHKAKSKLNDREVMREKYVTATNRRTI